MPAPVLRLGCGAVGHDAPRALVDVNAALDDEFRTAQAVDPRRALAMFVDPIPTLAARLASPKPGEHLVVRLCSECPESAYQLAGGWVSDLSVYAVSDTVGGAPRDAAALRLDCMQASSWRFAGGWVTHTRDGWRVLASPPRPALATVKPIHTRAELWSSYRRRWLNASIELDVETTGDTLVLAIPGLQRTDGFWSGPPEAGFRLTEVTVNGRRLSDFEARLSDQQLVLASAPGRSHVTVRYEGMPRLGEGFTQQRGDELQVSEWVPRVPVPAFHSMEVIVHIPESEGLVSSMELVRGDTERGWVRYAGASRRDRGPFLVVGDRIPDPEPGDVLVSRQSRIMPIGLPRCETRTNAVVETLDALTAIAAIPPTRMAMIHTYRAIGGQSGDDLIVVSSAYQESVCRPVADAGPWAVLLAHELAHTWFGARVRVVPETAASWWESLAEYVATSLWPAPGLAERRAISDAYAAVPVNEELPMLARLSARHYDQLSYGRGSLLLTALEDRIGRARMDEVLRGFIASNTDQLGSWDAVLASIEKVAGHEEAAWVRGWLSRAGAPDLRLRDVTVDAGRLRATLTQTSDVLFAGIVTVAFGRGDTILERHRVPFEGSTTPLDLAVPAGADTLVLDPEYRLPRKYDPQLPPEPAGRRVVLAPGRGRSSL